MIKILFICHGNICRSPMAEFIFKDMVNRRGLGTEYEIASAATSTEEIGNDIYYKAQSKLCEMGVPFTHRRARQMTVDDYSYYDKIYIMDKLNMTNILRIVGTDSSNKIHPLLADRPISDPWYTGDFASTYKDIVLGCEKIIERGNEL